MSKHDPEGVHCPDCDALPDEPCRTNSGGVRLVPHAHRIQLAFALVHPDAESSVRDIADWYRQRFPDVDATEIRCTPTKSQMLWRNRWAKKPYSETVCYTGCHTHEELRTLHAAQPIALPEKTDGEPVPDLTTVKEKEAVKKAR